MRRRLLQLMVIMLGLLVMQPALANKRNRQQKQPGGTVIQSVNVADQSIVLKVQTSGQLLSYQLVGATITINELPATLDEIKRGMNVISFTEAEAHILSQLDVDGKQAK